MSEFRLENFDIELRWLSRGLYGVSARAEGGESTAAELRVPFSNDKLKVFLLTAGLHARPAHRGPRNDEIKSAEDLGGRLFKALFKGAVENSFRTRLALARRNGGGVRIRLNLTKAPDLVDLPWEYLFDPQRQCFLSMDLTTPVVRSLDLPDEARPLTVRPPIRVLTVVANPKSGVYAELDVEEEWDLLVSALSRRDREGGSGHGQPMLVAERLSPPTYQGLLRRVQRPPAFHVLHFIGHGGFAQDTGGVLIFEDEDGEPDPVSAAELARLLVANSSARLAVLNACEGARTDRKDPFAGTAQTLVQQGLAAVVAMQFRISDEAAKTFAEEFYYALTGNQPVDVALAYTRMALRPQRYGVEWGTPALYLHGSQTRLLEVSPIGNGGVVEPEPVPPKLPKPHPIPKPTQPPTAYRPRVTDVIRPPLSVRFRDDMNEAYGNWVVSRGDHSLSLPEEFRIGIYPVTNLDFLGFVQSGGYTDEELWPGTARNAREQFRCRDRVTHGPASWPSGDQIPPGKENHPVSGISFYEAVAFSRWLQKHHPLAEGWKWILPTEDMWELVARTVEGLPYPWGREFDAERCNHRGSRTSPVTRFPNGKSLFGCFDMAGNVWEFVDAEDQHEPFCVLRGGSYCNSPQEVRTYLRLFGVRRDHRPPDFGMRCAAIPAPRPFVADEQAVDRNLVTVADEYLAVRVPDWNERLRVKDTLAQNMADIVLSKNLSKDLLANQRHEGLILALASAVQLRPEPGDVGRLLRVADTVTRLHVRYRILQALESSFQAGAGTPAEAHLVLPLLDRYDLKGERGFRDLVQRVRERAYTNSTQSANATTASPSRTVN